MRFRKRNIRATPKRRDGNLRDVTFRNDADPGQHEANASGGEGCALPSGALVRCRLRPLRWPRCPCDGGGANAGFGHHLFGRWPPDGPDGHGRRPCRTLRRLQQMRLLRFPSPCRADAAGADRRTKPCAQASWQKPCARAQPVAHHLAFPCNRPPGFETPVRHNFIPGRSSRWRGFARLDYCQHQPFQNVAGLRA